MGLISRISNPTKIYHKIEGILRSISMRIETVDRYGEIFHRFNDRLYEWEHLAAPRKNGMKMKGKKKNEVLFNAA